MNFILWVIGIISFVWMWNYYRKRWDDEDDKREKLRENIDSNISTALDKHDDRITIIEKKLGIKKSDY
jgi:hypothetical protein